MNPRYDILDKDNQLIWNFRDIAHTMRQTSEGKGGQKRVLIILRESGSMTQKELTDRLGVQPGSVSEVLGKLEAAGLIRRVPNGTDRRTTDICLTEAGEVAAQEAYTQRRQRHQLMFSSLTDQEKDQLLLLLEKLNADWEQKFRKPEGQ